MSIEAVTDLSPEPAMDTVGYANGRARREEIIRGASTQFAERGFGAATILEIAAACNISRAGLLHHFPSKEALLEAVLEARDAEDQARFKPFVKIPDGMGILIGMVSLAQHNRLVPGLIELFVRLSVEATTADHPANAYFSERYARIRRGTRRALVAAQAAGYLRPDIDPNDSSIDLTALMDGLQIQWLLDRDLSMATHLRAAITNMLNDQGAQAFSYWEGQVQANEVNDRGSGPDPEASTS